jgi:hypothetical protein
MKLLTRDQLRLITGGDAPPPAGCTASCGKGVPDAKCTGAHCTAIDGQGCTSDNGNTKCGASSGS